MTIRRPLGFLLAATLVLAAPRGAVAEEEGEKVFVSTCLQCHGPSSRPLDAIRLDRKKWESEIERMEGLGADIPTGKKREVLVDWLVRTHGPDSPPAGKAEKK
jgi:hypothetical protein